MKVQKKVKSIRNTDMQGGCDWGTPRMNLAKLVDPQFYGSPVLDAFGGIRETSAREADRMSLS